MIFFVIFTIMKLFRPVGEKEMELIVESGMKEFPPRLYWQPIFYPVLNYEYAAEIAEKWNVNDDANGNVGFVTVFEVDDKFISKYEVQTVGASHHVELWVPAEELAEFNKNIIGFIRVQKAFFKPDYKPTEILKKLFVD